MKEALTLSQLNRLVGRTLSLAMPDSYWVEAELARVNESNGHCYMEMVEKDKHMNTPVAKATARCWRSTWQLLKPHFIHVTGQPLHAGMKVLMQVHAQFHENYGFSWIVDDIDPTFSLGDMARKRQEILRQLQEEGVIDLQKGLMLSPFANRIAVVSSETAAGYGDFCNQLEDNGYGFFFHTVLFPAAMQGEAVEESVIHALNAINDEAEEYDAVVIIRGGGATSDLSGFDTLALAENVANFPLPVITGIGHERDESVLDRVAFQRVKTPTAAAAFLIDNLTKTYSFLVSAQETITNTARRRLQREHDRLRQLATQLPILFSLTKERQTGMLRQWTNRLTAAVRQQVADHRNRLGMTQQRIIPLVNKVMTDRQHQLQLLDQRVTAQDPTRLLRRGYSITTRNGKAVRDAGTLSDGDILCTTFAHGTIHSAVKFFGVTVSSQQGKKKG